MRILIAEDDFTSRSMLAGVLKKSGHEVLETVNGAEAWEAIQQCMVASPAATRRSVFRGCLRPAE